MWFLDDQFESYAIEVGKILHTCYCLCSSTQFDLKQFTIANRLLNELKATQQQIAERTIAFEAMTTSVQGTLLSFLPWTKAYEKRSHLAQSYQYYESLVHQILYFEQYIQKQTVKVPPQNGSQIVYENNLPHLNVSMTVNNSMHYLRVPQVSINNKLNSAINKIQDLSEIPKQKNPPAFDSKKRGGIFTPENQGQISNNINKEQKSRISINPRELKGKTELSNKKTIQMSAWRPFWQKGLPVKEQSKSIREWLGLPQKLGF